MSKFAKKTLPLRDKMFDCHVCKWQLIEKQTYTAL